MDETLIELMRQRGLILEQMRAVTAGAVGGKPLSAEDLAKLEGLKVQERALAGTIDGIKSTEQLAKTVTAPAGNQHAAQPTTQIADQMQQHAKPRIEVISDPNEKPFKNFGEQLRAVAKQARGEYDERLGLVQRAATGMNEQVPSDGGFAVQKDFVAGITDLAHDQSIIAAKCSRVPLSANSNGLVLNAIDESSRATGSRYGGVRSYWEGEADTATSSKPKLRRVQIELGKLLAFAYATDELLEDTSALGAIITKAFAEEFAFMLDDAIIRGDGVGKPNGILNSLALVTQAAEGGQTADTFNFQNAIKMRSRLHARLLAGAEWFINNEITTQLPQMTLLAGTSSPGIYLPATGAAGAPLDRLLGMPVNVIEHASAIGDVGDVLLANFKEYTVIDKGGLQAATSVHVRFLNDEQCFRFTYRVGGRTIWHSPITPYKGALTTSPFVALAAR